MRFAHACLLFLAITLIFRLSAPAAAADGWESIWKNQHTQARAAFKATLQQQPADAHALLGLALLNDQENASLEALATWQRYYQAAPASWAAMAYWPRVVELANDTGRYAALEEMARNVLAAKNAPPELRASARLAQAEALDRMGRFTEAEQVWAQMGYLRQWRVIGPFDNVSHSGFAKAFPPERELEFSKTYLGANNQSVAWHPLALVSRNGHCEVGVALNDTDESVFYAATALTSPKAQPVTFYLDPEGASKLYLNGKLLYSDDLYRRLQPLVADPFRVTATLQQGWNTLLVKVASNDSLTPSFAVRLAGPDSGDLRGLPCDPAQAKMPVAVEQAAVEHIDTATVALLRKQPMNPELALALGYQLRIATDYHASAEALRAALAQAPDAGWLHWALSDTLDADEQTDEAHAERDLALKQNNRLVMAELNLLGEQEESLQDTEYLGKLKALRAKYPTSPQVLWTLTHAYESDDMESDALKTAQAAVRIEAGPDGQAHLMSVLGSADRENEAVNQMTTALKLYPNSVDLLEARADLLKDKGKINEAIAVYQRLLQLTTPWPRYRQALAELYESAGKKAQAEQVWRALCKQCPHDADACASLASLLRDMGKRSEAIECYKTAIRLNPGEVKLREKLQVVSGEKPVMDQLPATPPEPILKEAAALKAPKATSAVVLLDESRMLVYPDFASDTRRHMIIKVFDEAGVKRFENLELEALTSSSDVTVEKARVIKADGKIQDATSEASRYKIPFPSLAPGDVIDATYRIEDYHRGGLARQLWTEWRFAIGDTPVKLSRFALMTPPGMQFTIQNHGAVPAPTIKEANGWRTQEWRMTDVPADTEEVQSTEYIDHGVWFDISTIPAWGDIVSWYSDLAGPRCTPDEAIRAKAAELTKDATTEEAKIRAIVTFVARKIKYQSMPFRLSQYIPTEGKQVLREHYGDCKDKAALVTALLAAVNIPADMVLLNGRSDGITPFLPSPRFTHAISRIRTTNGPLWVDGTAEQMEFGNLPIEDQGVSALIITPTTTELTLTPVLPIEKNAISVDFNLALDAGGKLSGDVGMTFLGSWGWMMRSMLVEVPESKYELIEKGVVSTTFKNGAFEKGALGNLQDPDKPFTLSVSFHAENYATTAGNFLLVQLPWNTEGRSDVLFADATRTQDLELSIAYGLQHASLRMTLPEGYLPEELAPKTGVSTPWGEYSVTYRMEKNVIIGEWNATIKTLRVPAADYPKFRDFMKAMSQEAKRSLVLKKQ